MDYGLVNVSRCVGQLLLVGIYRVCMWEGGGGISLVGFGVVSFEFSFVKDNIC